MSPILTKWQIDSRQKLSFILFLYQHPNLRGTSQELAEHSFLGDTPLLDHLISDLQRVGLLDRVNNCYQLRNSLEITAGLQDLALAFAQPLARQKLLDAVNLGGMSM